MPYAPRATFNNPYGPQVQFRTLDVLPPAVYYVTLDDQLYFQMYSNYPNNTVTLAVRLLNPQGELKIETLSLLTSGSGTNFYSDTLTGTEGYVMSACINAGNAPVGSTYCLLFLVRSADSPSPIISGLLVAGYAGNQRYLSYPTMPPRPELEGPGSLKVLSTAVAPGAEWSFSCPINVRWLVVGGSFNLQTSATVAARIPNILTLDQTGLSSGIYPAVQSQPASTLYYYGLNMGGQAVTNVPFNTIPLSARVLVQSGGKIESSTAALQPADQYSNVQIQVEEWVGL